MKKRVLLVLLLVMGVSAMTGCGKEENKNTSNENNIKDKNKVYTCIKEGEATGGGKLITKLIVTLNEENYIQTYQLINDDIMESEAVYNKAKSALENNVKEHNEKYPDSYKWTYEIKEKEQRTISTRTYDMSNVRDSQGNKYDEKYKYFLEDGTYDADSWMQNQIDKSNYTCSKN